MCMKKMYYLKFILVNLITLSRLIGAFLLPVVYFKCGVESLAVWVVIIFLTDFIDGSLSRKLKVESFFGGLLDAVSDKVFAFSLLAILTYYYPAMFIVLFLEFLIFVLNTLTFKDNKNIKSSKMGKFKTMILDINVSFMFVLLSKDIYLNYLPSNIVSLLNNKSEAIIYILIGVLIGMQLLTINDYQKKNLKEVSYEKVSFKEMLPFKEIMFRITNREFYIQNKDKKLKELLYKK